MRTVQLVSTGALFLLLGTVAPAFAQQPPEKEAPPANQEEKQAKSEKELAELKEECRKAKDDLREMKERQAMEEALSKGSKKPEPPGKKP